MKEAYFYLQSLIFLNLNTKIRILNNKIYKFIRNSCSLREAVEIRQKELGFLYYYITRYYYIILHNEIILDLSFKKEPNTTRVKRGGEGISVAQLVHYYTVRQTDEYDAIIRVTGFFFSYKKMKIVLLALQRIRNEKIFTSSIVLVKILSYHHLTSSIK